MRTPILLVLALALFACQPFDYGPAVLGAGSRESHLNQRNIERITVASGGLHLRGKFAVLADIHVYYDELAAAVRNLNADTSIDFVVIAGDVTQYGYAGEYRMLSTILSRLRAPVIVGIGNHDEQAGGTALYEELYGPTDFTFAWRGYEFVFFDDNARGTPQSVPDWAWLETALAQAGDSLRIIPVCHAPPFSDQLDSAKSQRLVDLYAENHAVIVIGAHLHNYHYGQPFGDGIDYLTADDIGDRDYVLVTLEDGKASVERVFF